MAGVYKSPLHSLLIAVTDAGVSLALVAYRPQPWHDQWAVVGHDGAFGVRGAQPRKKAARLKGFWTRVRGAQPRKKNDAPYKRGYQKE